VLTTPSTTSVQVAEDASPSAFGLKLNAITSTLTGATITQPTGTPPAMSVDLGATNPADGDSVKFTFNLPDGTTEDITLTASTATPLPANSFAIGADSAATAANLKAALNTSVGALANGPLVAASAVTAGDNFFDQPPMRVGTTPLGAATTLVAGTPANTVSWYNGETGTDSARGTAVAQVDQSITVQYGARADEQALRSQLQTVAVYAAVTTSATDPNANAQVAALNQRIAQNLADVPGTQSIQDIQADFAGAQASIKSTTDRQTQTQAITQTMLDSIEGINNDEVATKILALQTALQASYQTTASLYQMSLTKFLT
jgi:flagellar hook-associated protein 3 FlgL